MEANTPEISLVVLQKCGGGELSRNICLYSVRVDDYTSMVY